MNVDFKGYDEKVATFEVSGNLTEGDFVVPDGNFKVKKATANAEIIGVCVGVRDGFAAVQLGGYVEAKASAQIETGLKGLAATANSGEVAASQSAGKHLVIYSTAETVGFII